MDHHSKNLRDAFEKKGLTDEFGLNKIEEFIKAIETGEYKPRNKEKKLQELKSSKEKLLQRIKDKNS